MSYRPGFFLLHCLFLTCSMSAQGADYTNRSGVEFIKIESGCFHMGRDPNTEQGAKDELPRHKVCITKPFYIGKTEVTQDQWMKIMDFNPSKFKGGDRPVERVSWNTVDEFLMVLNEQEWGARYRLPTEAEWEYAARAGTATRYFFGDDPGELAEYAWYANQDTAEQTHPVAAKRPNPWGLHDVYGNVWELVNDRYGSEYYSHSPTDDPPGPNTGHLRVDRGGGWRHGEKHCRSAERDRVAPRLMESDLGFRLVLEKLPQGPSAE